VLLLSAALAGGYLFERFKLPRVIGEIVGGIMLGPSVLGLISLDVHNWLFAGFPAQGALLAAFYWFGLVLLMFTAGFSMSREVEGGTSRVIFALVIGALILPFAIGYASASIFDDTRVGDDLAFKLVMGIAVAVTSIPVISRIFLDLNMMQTLFARNVVGAATIQDLVLWTLLAVATAVQHGNATDAAGITRVVVITILFVALSFFLAPALLRAIRRNVFVQFSEASLTGYAVLLCLVFVASASLLSVNIVFAALIAGLVITRFNSRQLVAVKQRIADISIWFFVPIYFALVGLRLDLAHQLDIQLTLLFIVASSAIKVTSCTVAARASGIEWIRSFDYGVAMNTRGGPGIVLASVAHAAGIVDDRMFTALVLASIITSLATGCWLRLRLVRDPSAFGLASARSPMARPPQAPLMPAGNRPESVS
jgi:Kef-type K+ transport system membrane component KefB